MALDEISVVVPTRNCLHLLRSGIDLMLEWVPQVKEVIVVDSESSDGTVEYLKEQLQQANVRFLSHPPGLYQSWNYGISETTGKWVHVSTAGDTISLEDLSYLAQIAEQTDADVITAPPAFVVDDIQEPVWDRWPIHDLLEREPNGEVVILEGLALLVFAMEHCRLAVGVQSWLGSSASNLYKRSLFQGRGFPTNCGHSGDVMFGLRYASEIKAAFVRRNCGRFVFHRPTNPPPDIVEHFADVYGAEYSRCQTLIHDLLRDLMTKNGLQNCLTPAVEASWWRALNYSPEDMIRIGQELRREKRSGKQAQEKLTAARAERDKCKEQARSNAEALKRYKKLIPKFLRNWLKVETAPETTKSD